MKTVQLRIIGKVQGVWYRASAKDKALSLGLKGKVWNEPDGNVGAVIQGHEGDISAFVEWCRHGPPLAVVTEVIVEEVSHEFAFTSFEITKA
jgi:acylphosphatase